MRAWLLLSLAVLALCQEALVDVSSFSLNGRSLLAALSDSNRIVIPVVLQMLNLGIAFALWWPFLRQYDRALLDQEPIAP